MEIQQTVGRATRVSAGKREGFVLLPVYSSADGSEDAAGDEGAAGEEGAAPEGAGADAGAALAGGFETAINVIRAMLEADEALQQRPSAALVEVGRTSRSLDALAVLGPRVEAVGVPLTLVKEQLGTVLLRLGDPWDRWYGRLVAYAAEHGDCLVRQAYKTAGGFALGQWVHTQRQAYKGAKGGLSASQVSRLEALGMVWEPLAAAWEAGRRELAAYAAEHGGCLVPKGYKTADGYALGTWVGTQRQAYKGANGGLSAPRASRLEALGMVWNVR